MKEALLRLVNLGKDYLIPAPFGIRGRSTLVAVDCINLEIMSGQTLGLVGESGCGKTTLGKLICRLEEPSRGEIYFKGQPIHQLHQKALRRLRTEFQPVFQDPFGSLNPRFSVYDTLKEPLSLRHLRHGLPEILALLEQVGLGEELLYRYPHQLSGGQRQRLGLARALAMEPNLIIADEPVSSLDVSIQAQILNLFLDLQQRMHLTLIFISHDLRVVGHMADYVAVMYVGRMMELAPVHEIFLHPQHPYTWALLQALPRLKPGRGRKRAVLQGDLPTPINPPPGCRFYTRCRYHVPQCLDYENQLLSVKPGHQVACCQWSKKDLREVGKDYQLVDN